MLERVQKMLNRGFDRIFPDLEWLPDSTDVTRLVVDHTIDEKAKEVVAFFNLGKHPADPANPRPDLAIPSAKIHKVWKVKSAFLERIYDAHREMIRRENGDENEQFGWHAPRENKDETRVSICRLGVDNRYWAAGFFGNAAYFAKFPLKSDTFAQSQGNNRRVMFLFKVLCGKQEEVIGEGLNGVGAKGKFQPARDHHSVLGKGGPSRNAETCGNRQL